MSNLVEGGHGFFNFFKGGHLRKSLDNPALESHTNPANIIQVLPTPNLY